MNTHLLNKVQQNFQHSEETADDPSIISSNVKQEEYTDSYMRMLIHGNNSVVQRILTPSIKVATWLN